MYENQIAKFDGIFMVANYKAFNFLGLIIYFILLTFSMLFFFLFFYLMGVAIWTAFNCYIADHLSNTNGSHIHLTLVESTSIRGWSTMTSIKVVQITLLFFNKLDYLGTCIYSPLIKGQFGIVVL